MVSPDDRSPWAEAVAWYSRLTAIGLEMALPAIGGHELDRWLGTGQVCLAIGLVLGFTVGLWHLVQLTKPDNSRRR
jgi:hypothetical protein